MQAQQEAIAAGQGAIGGSRPLLGARTSKIVATRLCEVPPGVPDHWRRQRLKGPILDEDKDGNRHKVLRTGMGNMKPGPPHLVAMPRLEYLREELIDLERGAWGRWRSVSSPHASFAQLPILPLDLADLEEGGRAYVCCKKERKKVSVVPLLGNDVRVKNLRICLYLKGGTCDGEKFMRAT
ncbi:hypothetical protein VNO77_27443 [Canavalia gladiata]|uniref:Uncharacterized protein n=1 Tax=Canavalia gladiata TaxID=3824 RepID=A0AAN9KVC2_CANGL